jgi:hypothetical protein
MRMVAIKISTTIGEDRRLVIDLPDDMPIGTVEVIIRSADDVREVIREKLRAAGALVTTLDIPPDAVRLTPEERQRIGTLPPHARPSEALIDEDRGRW